MNSNQYVDVMSFYYDFDSADIDNSRTISPVEIQAYENTHQLFSAADTD